MMELFIIYSSFFKVEAGKNGFKNFFVGSVKSQPSRKKYIKLLPHCMIRCGRPFEKVMHISLPPPYTSSFVIKLITGAWRPDFLLI